MNIDYSKYYWKNDMITLRQPKPGDWEYLIHHMFDSQERFFFNDEIDMPVDIDEYRKKFEEREKPAYISFAIENAKGEHVGIANLFGIDERNGVFGPIGILINPAHRNKGYAAAALKMLGKYMFNERRMHKWNSGYVEGNAASAALHNKIGFEIEGVAKDMCFHDGRYWNHVICGITAEQFFERNK